MTQDYNQLTRELDESRQERDESRRERDESRRENAPLHFANLLTLCHEEVGQVRVEQDHSTCTKGNVGDPRDKLVPVAVRSWAGFPKLQESTFSQVKAVYDQYPEPPATFPSSTIIVNSLKRKARPLASELDLRKHQADCVEELVQTIIQDLVSERSLPADFSLGTDIHLDNHPNNLSKEEVSGLATGKFADKIFIRKVEGDEKRIVVIIEYKPPHKLSVEALRVGLNDLDIQEIIHRVTISKDKAVKYKENSEEAVAVVLAQVFTYMIDSGIRYAYLTTGEAFVFLSTPEDNRHTLLYHMVTPGDASATGNADWISSTAIGQVLSFYILACGGILYDQRKRIRHREDALKWIKDEDKLIANMTPSPEKPQTPTSEFKPRSKRHAPAHSQSNISRKLRSSASGETPALNAQVKKDDSDDPDGGDGRAPSDPFASALTLASRASKGTQSQGTNKTSQSTNETSGSSRKRHESYCSHQCLLGLTTKGALDPNCANYEFHLSVKKGRGKQRHAINIMQFRELLFTQLQEDMDNNIHPLGIQGSRGALFKMTLFSHGYTMIGKGTPPHYVPDLRAEKAVYDQLREAQGQFIPVCLGAIDSPRRYFYHPDVPIFHWLLLSFAGTSLYFHEFQDRKAEIEEMRIRLRRYGIVHGDISSNNILWDDQTKKLMIIDFERVKFAKKEIKEEKPLQKTTLLKEMSPNKILRKRKAIDEGVVARPAKVQVR